MPWFYFVRREGKLHPLNPRVLPPRPRDANPTDGDPLTPWYSYADHFDSEHVHVFSEDLEGALRRAELLLSSKA
jgi:hypothetical protein